MMDDFLSDLNGGFQGAGMGASLLGGMHTAGIGFAANPWVAGGLLAGGAGLGILNAMDPAKKRAMRMNERLGKQEAEMNDLSLEEKRTQMSQDAMKRRSWNDFGNIFSGYLGAMARARPTGASAFAQDLGV